MLGWLAWKVIGSEVERRIEEAKREIREEDSERRRINTDMYFATMKRDTEVMTKILQEIRQNGNRPSRAA